MLKKKKPRMQIDMFHFIFQYNFIAWKPESELQYGAVGRQQNIIKGLFINN